MGQHERVADAHGHHGDSGVGVAHDHGEQHHADGVHHDTGVHIALGDDVADQVRNHIADTGSGEDGAQAGQQHGQHGQGAHGGQHALGIVQEGGGLVVAVHDHQQDDGHENAQSHAVQGGQADAHAGDGADDGQHADAQGGDKDLHADLLIGSLGLGLGGSRDSALLDLLEDGGDAHHHHQDAAHQRGQPAAQGKHDAQHGPEDKGAHGFRVLLILQVLHTAVDAQQADDKVDDLHHLGGQAVISTHKKAHSSVLPYL